MIKIRLHLIPGDGLLEVAWNRIIGIGSLIVVVMGCIVVVTVMDPRVVLRHSVREVVTDLPAIFMS